jgi:Bacterial dnaA protein helix-turn-helix
MNWELHDARMHQGIQAYRDEIRPQVMRQIEQRQEKPLRPEPRLCEATSTVCVAKMRTVVHRTAAVLDIPVDRILCRSHQWHLVEAREVIAFILHPNYSFSQIGRILNRHHTTILHSVRQANKKHQASQAFRDAVEKVRGAR